MRGRFRLIIYELQTLWWDSHILPTFISAAGAGLPGYNSHNVAGENGVDSYIPEAVDGIEYTLCQ